MYYPQKIIKLGFCFVLSFFIHGELTAQRFNYYNQIKQVNESGAAPAKASMAYTLDSPVNLLTGAACFDIPIYTIKTGDFVLPISLHYETSGFKVATIASNVGLGWNLNAGGYITRTVKGFIDESPSAGYCSQTSTAHSIHQDIHKLTQVEKIDTLLNNQVEDLFTTLLHVTDNKFDAEPDIYSFSFGDYSGSFVFDTENNIHLIPEQNFIIERTGCGFVITLDNGDRYYFGEDFSAQEIVIATYNCPLFWKVNEFQTGNPLNDFLNFRYRYLFNGNLNGFNLKDWDSDYPVTWFLTKIETGQSNKQILFQYETDEVRTYIGTDETYMMGQYSSCYEIPELTPGYDWVVHRINRYKFSHVPRLRRILWDNGKVDFIPSDNYREDLDYVVLPSNNFGGRNIDNIVISSMDNEIGNAETYSVDLNWDYFSDTWNQGSGNGYPDEYLSYYKRLRLNGLTFNDINNGTSFQYQFIYNRKNNNHCVSRNTSQVDYWGYFKPREPDCYDFFIERYIIKPIIYYYENGKEDPLYNSVYSVWRRSGNTPPTYIFEGNDMIPDLIGSKEFTLREVKLPAGGTVKFEYELNDFFFDNLNIIGPGVRVKTVSYETNDNYSFKSYKKEYSYNENNHSSGRISNIPTIGVRNLFPSSLGWLGGVNDDKLREDYKTARQFSTVTDMGTTCESLVQYGKVTEKCSNSDSSMGKAVYYHQLNLTVADSVLKVGDETFIKKTKCNWSYLYEYPNGFGLGNSNHHNDFYIAEHVDNTPLFTTPLCFWYNGFLTKKEYYNKNNELLESIEFKYSLKPKDDSVFYIQSKFLCKYSTIMQIPEFTVGLFTYNYSYPIYLYDILWGVNYYKTGVRQLDTIIHKYYSEGDDNLANVTTQTFDYNENNYVSVEKTENSDGSVVKQTYSYPFEYYTWHTNPVYSNMIERNMLNSVVEQYTTVNNKVTHGLYCKFKAFGTNNSFIKPEKLYKLRTTSPLSNFHPTVTQTGQDSHYELTNEMRYDHVSGNLVEVWDENDGKTTYVWGFHNSLLLAKIQNATDIEVRNALNCTIEALQEKTDTEELIGIFQALRAALPNAMVISYTYDLFQNLVSITDPSGKTSRYEYDDALRLKLTRDVENNILQKYEYHYHNQ